MKKQFRLFIASAMLCLMFCYSALAGDTPISNLTDGDTPISNITVAEHSDSDDDPASEFTNQLADLLSFFLN